MVTHSEPGQKVRQVPDTKLWYWPIPSVVMGKVCFIDQLYVVSE
jgi:hypothetical protein